MLVVLIEVRDYTVLWDIKSTAIVLVSAVCEVIFSGASLVLSSHLTSFSDSCPDMSGCFADF